MADDEKDIVTLEFDDGEDAECEVLGVFDANGKEYIALVPQDDSGDVYIYGYKEVSDDEYEMFDIEDDEEFKAATAEFEAIMEQED